VLVFIHARERDEREKETKVKFYYLAKLKKKNI
jgi:hypothetical protein